MIRGNVKGEKMKKGKWVLILYPYGSWEIIGYFKSKKEAVTEAQILQGIDEKPNKYGDLGNYLIMKTEKMGVCGYEKESI
jgi:hypothetical protein